MAGRNEGEETMIHRRIAAIASTAALIGTGTLPASPAHAASKHPKSPKSVSIGTVDLYCPLDIQTCAPADVNIILSGTRAGDLEQVTAQTQSPADTGNADPSPYTSDPSPGGEFSIKVPVRDCGFILFCQVRYGETMKVDVTVRQRKPDGSPDGTVITGSATRVCDTLGTLTCIPQA